MASKSRKIFKKIKNKKKQLRIVDSKSFKKFIKDRSDHLKIDPHIMEIYKLIVKPCIEKYPENWKGNMVQWIEYMWGVEDCPILGYITLEPLVLSTVNRFIYLDIPNGNKDVEISDGGKLKIDKYTKIFIRKEKNGMAEIEIDKQDIENNQHISYTYTLDDSNYNKLINRVKIIC